MFKKLALFALCVCLCVPAFCGLRQGADMNVAADTTINEDRQHLADLQNRLNSLKSNRAELEKQREEANAAAQTLLQEKTQLEKEYTVISQQVSTISEIITSYNTIIEETEKEGAEMENTLDKQLDDFGTVLVELYKNGDDSKLEIFLRSDSYYAYISYVEYMEQILKSSDTMIEDIKQTIEGIDKRKQEHEDAKVKLEEKNEELEEAKKELAAKDKELDKKLGEQRDKIELSEKEREQAKQDEDQVLKDIAELQQQIKDKLAATYSGAFSWPFASNVAYSITSRFGNRTDGPFVDFEHHNGIDLACARGTAIRAVDSGIVTYAGYRGSFGNVVFVEHDGGITTIYAHCDSVLVTSGTRVMKDQVIARVGATGQASGYHLHFAVQKGGAYVNPEQYLPSYYLQ